MENVTSKNRIEFFDVAKGIGIILVVIGHSSIINRLPILGILINAFHMPLFFFISGYFFKPNPNYRLIINKYLHRYIIPYFFTICSVLIIIAIRYPFYNSISLQNWIVASVFGNGYTTNLGANGVEFLLVGVGGVWFLLALPISLLLLNYLLNYFKNKQVFISVIIISLIGYISYKYVVFPFNIQNGMFALIYVYSGYVVKLLNDKYMIITNSPFSENKNKKIFELIGGGDSFN